MNSTLLSGQSLGLNALSRSKTSPGMSLQKTNIHHQNNRSGRSRHAKKNRIYGILSTHTKPKASSSLKSHDNSCSHGCLVYISCGLRSFKKTDFYSFNRKKKKTPRTLCSIPNGPMPEYRSWRQTFPRSFAQMLPQVTGNYRFGTLVLEYGEFLKAGIRSGLTPLPWSSRTNSHINPKLKPHGRLRPPRSGEAGNSSRVLRRSPAHS